MIQQWAYRGCALHGIYVLGDKICGTFNIALMKTSHSHVMVFFSRPTQIESCGVHFNFGFYFILLYFETNFVWAPMVQVHRVKKKSFMS